MGLRGPKPRRRKVVWSCDLAYAVGLMASDGNLSPDGRHLIFVSKDHQQIRNIKKCLGVTANESRSPSGRTGDKNMYYRLQWGDVVLYQFFVSIGLTPNKSKTIWKLSVPDEYFFDYLRGHFDGDGSFYSYFDPRWKSSFMFYVSFVSASEKFIEWLREGISRRTGVRGSISRNKARDFFQLKFAKRESLLLLSRMYENPEGLFLDRKKLKIEHALRIVGKSLLKT